ARSKGRRLTLLGIQFRSPGGLGGPAVLAAGKMPRGSGEVALDRSAAHLLNTQLNENISLNGTAVKVAGITAGTNLLATQFIFGDLDSSVPRFVSGASFGLVEASNGDAVEQVAMQI